MGGAANAAAGRAAERRRLDRARSASGADPKGPIAEYYAKKTKYPANNQIWHVSTDSVTGAFNADYIDNVAFGTTPAPKGHYVLKLFNKDYYAVSAIPELATMGAAETDARPTCVCPYAGRIFYSGVEDLGYQGTVWFSRVVRNYQDLGRCYQEQDPTAEDFNELVATDGGEIPIQNAVGISALIAVQNGVLVFANNGVWYINGSDSPFTAINYNVDKIHSSGIVSPTAFADVDGTAVFCASDGIYAISKTAQGIAPISMTDESIKTLYRSISTNAKKKFSIVYSKEDRKIYFMYGNDDAYDSALKYALVFDLVLKAWTALDFSAVSSPEIIGFIDKKNFSAVNVVDQVVVGASRVVVSGDPVKVTETFSGQTGAGLKLLTYTSGTNITMSEFNSDKYYDWMTAVPAGVAYDAYVEVGPISAGELMRSKQLLYVTSFFERTEDGWELVDGEYQLQHQSSSLLTAKWGWSDSSISGRWTTPQQVYKLKELSLFDVDAFDYGYDIVRSKVLIRGSGRAFALKWEAEAGKDMRLAGWAAPIKVNAAEE